MICSLYKITQSAFFILQQTHIMLFEQCLVEQQQFEMTDALAGQRGCRDVTTNPDASNSQSCTDFEDLKT